MNLPKEIEERWDGMRYYAIRQYFINRFGERVFKVSVSIAETCPVREGNKDICIFCDEWGSAAYHLERDKSLVDQIHLNREKILKRYKVNKFLVYFQAYTNTFDRAQKLEDRFDTALAQDNISGIVVGTRPDCLPARLMPIFKKVHESSYLMVELGAQSFFDDQLSFLRRGHTAQQTVDAVHRLKEQTGVDIGIHLMFGLPGETDDHLIETARVVNQLPISNVKLHNLHVLTKTPLEQLYMEGKFEPLELDEYARRVILFLRYLSPKIAIQRLAAVASRWDELVAPSWTKEKLRPISVIESKMKEQGVYQGDLFGELDAHCSTFSDLLRSDIIVRSHSSS